MSCRTPLQTVTKRMQRLRAWVAASPSTRDPRLIRHQIRRHGLRSVLFKSYLYDESFFRADEQFRCGYVQLADLIFEWAQPASAADFGCGRGFLVEYLARKGVDVTGIEVSPAALKFVDPGTRSRIQIRDLTKRHDVGAFDLAVSVEVAEHLPKRASQTFVQNLTRAAKKNIVFSAAKPGQWGAGHINCQPQSFWIRLFEQQGWRYDESASESFSRGVQGSGALIDAAPWLIENFMLFGPGGDWPARQ
jgi:SAM-dependent methyltransferase